MEQAAEAWTHVKTMLRRRSVNKIEQRKHNGTIAQHFEPSLKKHGVAGNDEAPMPWGGHPTVDLDDKAKENRRRR